jgi:hypothetical protein
MMLMAYLSYMLAEVSTLYHQPPVDIAYVLFKKRLNAAKIVIYWLLCLSVA